MKECAMCKKTKDDSDFHVARKSPDGLASYCRSCMSEYHADWYSKNQDRRREQNRRYQLNNSEKAKKTSTEWRLNNRERFLEIQRNSKSRNPHKVRARSILTNAVKSGRVDKPNNCSSCGNYGIMQAHHNDYDKPLDVVWLCPKCHGLIHRTS